MRHGCAALLLLVSSAAAASAQEQVLSPDLVVARLKTFDSNGDGRVATAELSERMQVIVTRGDTSGDGALDVSELRALALRRLEFVSEALQNRHSFGGYGFGDSAGLISTRSHIHNTLDDLRLTPEANEEARRIASTFVDQLENTARLNMRSALAPMLTEEQLGEFERTLMPPGAGGRTSLRAEIVIPCGFCRVAGSDARPTQAFTISGSPLAFLERYQLAPDQFMAASAAVEAFKADQQLDDTRRSALVAQLAYVLTGEESDNFRAALARRPVVQTSGVMVAALPASR